MRSIMSFGPAYAKISVLIDSGHTTVKQGYVRLYTTSPGPYERRACVGRVIRKGTCQWAGRHGKLEELQAAEVGR